MDVDIVARSLSTWPSDANQREVLVTAERLDAHPIVVGRPTRDASRSDDSEAMAPEEKDQIMAQLQMLGYME